MEFEIIIMCTKKYSFPYIKVLKSHGIGTESIQNIVFCTESVQKLLYVKLLKKYGIRTEIAH